MSKAKSSTNQSTASKNQTQMKSTLKKVVKDVKVAKALSSSAKVTKVTSLAKVAKVETKKAKAATKKVVAESKGLLSLKAADKSSKKKSVKSTLGKSAAVVSKPLALLVSVRSAEEAKEALAAGADLIDVKEPSKGPLGIAETEVVSDVIAAVGKKVPISAALGEWSSNSLTEAVWHLELPLAYVKWGLSNYRDDPGWGDDLLDCRRQIPARTEVVAVAYADTKRAKSISPAEVAKFARRYRYKAFLLDTFIKDGKSVLDIMKADDIRAIFATLSEAGIKIAIGGSLKFEQIPILKTLGADFVAVRGAVCSNGRAGELDSVRVKKWKKALSTV